MKTRRTRKRLCLGFLAIGLLSWTTAQAQSVNANAALPKYVPVSGVSGNLNSIGSDTLNNLMTLWAESFQAVYPNVKIQVEGKGSSTAPPALIEGAAQLGPMSRPMKPTEIDAFEKKYGYKPTEIKVAVDALALFVHKDNRIAALTIEQADGIFSSTRKTGAKPVERWNDLGVTGALAHRPVSLYGRNSASGTYGFFKEHVLKGGDYKPTVKEQPGSSSVVQAVATDPAGIGYSGIGYKTSGVRAVPLADRSGKPIEATAENAISGKYPLARFLYVYMNVKPGAAPDKLTSEFLRFVLSQPGQTVVVKDGYYPLPARASAKELQKISAK